MMHIVEEDEARFEMAVEGKKQSTNLRQRLL